MSPSAVSIFVHTSRGWWLLTSISIFNFVLALYLSNTELGTSISYLGILLDQGKTSNFCENSNHSTSNLCADVRHVFTAQESDHKNETTIASLYRPNSKTFNRTSIDATIFTTNDLTIDSTISTTNNLNTTMTRTTTSWCILNKRNTASFGHFPHALQVLSLCWSFFQTQPVGRKCGVYVRNLPSLGPKHLDWRAALVLDVMKCDYVSGAEPPTSLDPNYSYRPKLSQVMEHHFFSKPDDAKVLRQNLNLANTTIGREKTSNRSEPNSVGLHIGLIDRKTTRKILNLDAIETALRLEFPDAFLERSTMDDMTPLEQFQWWNRQHVVVLGHGAAANLRNASSIGPLISNHPYPQYSIWSSKPWQKPKQGTTLLVYQ